MSAVVSVVIPTHNPNPQRLRRTLEGLRGQTLPAEQWELVVVDNGSADPEALSRFDLAWHPQSRVVREDRLGLTHARLAGIRAGGGEFLVFVDDDNVLDPDYLREVARAFGRHPEVGAAGGKSLPEWEAPPEPWVQEFAPCLALRDLGDEVMISRFQQERSYPRFAPVGAGMALRRAAVEAYVRKTAAADGPLPLDRRGTDLSSGGDNDIVLTVLEAGWEVGYFPGLRLTHLIPRGRTDREYLGRLNHDSTKSWVQVLGRHGLRPWPPVAPWTVWARKLRAFWRYRAWRDPAAYVRWRGACGMFEGRAALPR